MNGHVMEAEVAQPEARRQTPDQTPKKRHGYLIAAALAVVFLVLAIVGLASRFSEKRALAKETEALAVLNVAVIHPKVEPPQQDLVLPSTLQAYIESPIYARTNGYLLKWYKD